MGNRILVLGSSNVDFILKIPRFHNPGETITGENLITAFGGKGANQAIAARRMGGEVCFLTKLGKDSFGDSYAKYLTQNGLPQRWLLRDRKLPTGVALIELGPTGENRIIVSPGANGSLSPQDLKRNFGVWKGAKVFVTQLEIPMGTVSRALGMAKDRGVVTLLNPSPARELSSKLLSLTDFLVPNEWEAQVLTGIRMEEEGDLSRMAQKLLRRGTKNVIITLGRQGLYFQNEDEEIRIKAFRIQAVDTTAAGDAFMGALAYSLAGGRPIREALRWASAAGALAATKLGAQPSLPRWKELQRFLAGQSQSP